MPTYEFRCPAGHEFEKFYRKISDSQAELPCPECGQTAVRAISGGAGLHFKGSGFYKTDYASSSSSGSTSSSSSTSSSATPAASPASSSTPSSETKSDSSKAD